jgi:hypothetical protein
VIALDNASIHHSIDQDTLDRWFLEHKAVLFYLPPYSPELNLWSPKSGRHKVDNQLCGGSDEIGAETDAYGGVSRGGGRAGGTGPARIGRGCANSGDVGQDAGELGQRGVSGGSGSHKRGQRPPVTDLEAENARRNQGKAQLRMEKETLKASSFATHLRIPHAVLIHSFIALDAEEAWPPARQAPKQFSRYCPVIR